MSHQIQVRSMATKDNIQPAMAQLRKEVELRLDLLGMGRSELSKKSGLSKTMLRLFLKGYQDDVNLSSLRELLRALGYDVELRLTDKVRLKEDIVIQL